MRKAIIIGAGPAGLTAALELLRRTDILPIVLEKSEYMGGISRTVAYRGNRIDIGGHRFFSKSDRVMDWWLDILPMESRANGNERIAYQGKSRSVENPAKGPDADKTDCVMLLRRRKSRIFFNRKFFEYPIRLSVDTLSKLGLWKAARIGFSYLHAAAFPIRNETNLEQFFINRFGRELYLTFFKSYTEKVWGISCEQISAEWGAQRIKGLSILKTVVHFIRQSLGSSSEVSQKDVETSLIEQFLYPKLGPGQMWDEVARRVKELGGEIHCGFEASRILTKGNDVRALEAVNAQTGEKRTFEGDFFFSTMPVQELIRSLDQPVPAAIREISDGLMYRDFITVGLLVEELKIRDASGAGLIEDNWIYIQEPDVLVGRLQVFNNWSPYMVADKGKVWIGLEYFCFEKDDLWKLDDARMIELAKEELSKIGIIETSKVLDACVLRMPKTYPCYFGTYDRFSELQSWIMGFENLFLIGRNGMHKYNNQDHSMLTAMTAVDNLAQGRSDQSNIWAVNTEQEYHETSDEREHDGNRVGSSAIGPRGANAPDSR